MGLRVIPEAEASEITLKPGDPGTLVLTHRPHKSGGVTYTRVTILDKATHKILEHQLRSADQKAVLAWAKVPEGYMEAADLADLGRRQGARPSPQAAPAPMGPGRAHASM